MRDMVWMPGKVVRSKDFRLGRSEGFDMKERFLEDRESQGNMAKGEGWGEHTEPLARKMFL